MPYNNKSNTCNNVSNVVKQIEYNDLGYLSNTMT